MLCVFLSVRNYGPLAPSYPVQPCPPGTKKNNRKCENQTENGKNGKIPEKQILNRFA